ncbi:hypothetical protein L9F63_014657, partial [Diploptera punctata]
SREQNHNVFRWLCSYAGTNFWDFEEDADGALGLTVTDCRRRTKDALLLCHLHHTAAATPDLISYRVQLNWRHKLEDILVLGLQDGDIHFWSSGAGCNDCRTIYRRLLPFPLQCVCEPP